MKLEHVFIARIEVTANGRLLDVGNFGAYKTFRDASQYLINKGFEPFYDKGIDELLEESVSFIYVDEEENLEYTEEHIAWIEKYNLHD